MKKQKQEKIKKRSNFMLIAVAALVAVGSFLPASVALAWGPERATYTMEKPADHVTFNSITNNNTVGDERNFVHVKEAGAEKYSDSVSVVPGKEYVVYITYHNDAASNLNASGKGIATGTRLRTQFPTMITPANNGQISAVISATNADPKEVWDEAYMTTTYDKVLLHYKRGSAVIHNGWASNGQVLSEQMFGENGTYLGVDELNGLLPGCAEFGGYITYTLVAEDIGAEVSKLVSKDGTNFYENVSVKRGDEVTFEVNFKNSGTKDLTNVTFHDVFPEGLELVEGTTYLYNNSHPNGERLSDLINKNGYDTGAYGTDGYARIVYKAKVSNTAKCGNLVNKMFVDHDNGEVSDGATVSVECSNESNPDKEEGGTSKEGESKNMPSSLPNTGPAQVAGALIIVAGITVLAVYWLRSYAALKKMKK